MIDLPAGRLLPERAHARPGRARARRGLLALAVLTVLTAWWVLGWAQPAAAHDQLVGTEPAADAVVAEPPAEVVLELSDDVLDISAVVVVTGPDGTPVTAGEAQVEGRSVSVALEQEVPDGRYTVAWRVVSADGHPIDGTFGYDVGTAAAVSSDDPSTAPPPTGDDGSAAPEPGRSTAGPVVVAVLVGTAGVLAAALLALRLRRRRRPPTSPAD